MLVKYKRRLVKSGSGLITTLIPQGGIWIGWRPGWVNVTVAHVQEQLIVCTMQDQVHQVNLVDVYGLLTIADWRGLWRGLSQCVQHQEPMIVIGDFNAVCTSHK